VKAAERGRVVDSDPQELDRHLAMHRHGLFGEPDLAHSAFAKPAHQAVRTDRPAFDGNTGR